MLNIQFPQTEYIGCKFPEVTGRNGELVIEGRSKKYIYRLLPGMARPQVGDMCVVSCSNGFQVAVVVTLDEIIPADWKNGEVANVVGFVNWDAYQNALRAKKEKEALKKELMRMKKEMDEQFALDMYAERSPEFAALLERYKSL